MKKDQKLTHQVVVNAYLIKDNKFLLLKRSDPPHAWGPPGGKLNINEDPENGLKREVREETGMQIEIQVPVNVWFGNFQGKTFLSIDYLCAASGNNLQLSNEHTDFKWLTLQEIKKENKKYLFSPEGFQISDFELAWKTYLCHKNLFNLSY